MAFKASRAGLPEDHTTTLISGCSFRKMLVADKPSSLGISTSTTSTSGDNFLALVKAFRPSLASPTTIRC
jgi:hypothetical protein